MAKLVKIERAGTVLFVEEKKVDFYLEHGYVVLQPDKTPAHLKPPLFPEPKEPPAVIKVQIVNDEPTKPEPEPQPVQPFEVGEAPKPKRKTRKKKAE